MIAAAAAVSLAAMLFAGCGAKPRVQVMMAVFSKEPLVIETKVTPGALHAAPVIPSVSGRIVSAMPVVGTVVHAGDVLFQIDASSYEAQAAALEAKMLESRSSHLPLPADDSMAGSLLKQGIITRAEYERIQGRKSMASRPAVSGAVDPSLAAAYRQMQRMIASCTVRAPIDGVISQNFIGDAKTAVIGKTALIIRQNTPVTASIEIPSRLDEAVDRGKDEKTMTVTLSDGKEVWYGELKKQGGNERYTHYRVQADNPDDAIIIGNEYSVRIESGQTAELVVLPASSLIGGDQVAVVLENHLVDLRRVQIAGTAGDHVMVMEGLGNGDRVIINPPSSLDVGMEVSVIS